MKKILIALAALVTMMPLLVEAHHGWSVFDSKAELTLTGVVTDFHFVNPHSVVDFEVKDSKGKAEAWQGELTSALHLKRKGWSPISLEAGDAITVVGHKSRTG